MFFLDNWKRLLGNYGREAAAFLNWETDVLHSGIYKNWVTLPLLFDKKKLLNSYSFYTTTQTSQFYTKSLRL